MKRLGNGLSISNLHQAALENDLAAVKKLLRNQVDPNGRDENGFTPLHYAAQQHALAIAKLLLSTGAEVDAVDRFGNTPLGVAVFESRGRGEMIRLLRASGA